MKKGPGIPGNRDEQERCLERQGLPSPEELCVRTACDAAAGMPSDSLLDTCLYEAHVEKGAVSSRRLASQKGARCTDSLGHHDLSLTLEGFPVSSPV